MEVADATIARVHGQREAVERDLTRVYAAALRELGTWLIEHYDLPADASVTAAAAPLTPDGLLDLLTKWNQIVATLVRPRMLAAFIRHWSWVADNLAGRVGDVDTRVVLGPNVRDVRAAAAFDTAAPRIRGIGRSMHDELSTLLRQQFEEGATPGDTAQAVRDTVGQRLLGPRGVTPSRARMIARTETAAIVSGADQAVAEELAANDVVTAKRWLATKDERTRPAHQRLNGQTVGVHQSFKVPDDGATLRYPGDPEGRADLVINCRCTTLLQVVED